MFPAQTSFIPVTVALVRYIEAHGFLGNYPFWYLGSTPVKYLIGFHKVLTNFSLFDLSLWLVVDILALTTPEWLLAFIPFGVFLPRIVKKIKERQEFKKS